MRSSTRPRAAVRDRVAALLGALILLGGCATTVEDLQRPDVEPAALAPAAMTPAPGAGGPWTHDAKAPETPVEDPDGVDATFAAIAAALRDADPATLGDWLADPSGEVGTRWRDRAANLAGVPLASYELRLDRDVPAMTTSRVRERWGSEAQLVLAVEEHALEGFDADGPRREQLLLTVVREGGRWLLADDRGGGALGLVRSTQLWDLGPVEATQRGPLLALHRPDARGIDRLLDEAGAALELARERWPLAWSGRVPLLVPADADELTELLNVSFELDEFVAFATATPVVAPDEHRLTGARIVLNPDRFDGRDARTRERVLVHELVHIASRPAAATTTPLWLEEGVAQVLGERRSSTGTRLLTAAGADGRRLPTDAEFTTGGRDGIHLAYQRAWGFTDHLVDRFGADAVARFYEAAGSGAARAPGTVGHRVDAAAREVLGGSVDELVAAWRDAA